MSMNPQPRPSGIGRTLTIILLVAILIVTGSLLYLQLQQRFNAETASSEEDATQAGVLYGAQSDIRHNMRKLQQSNDAAIILSEDAAPGKKISITIDGMLDEASMLQMVAILQEYETQATFFISGMQATEEPEVVRAISQAGFEIGNYTLRASKYMERYTQEELVEDFTCTNKIIREITGINPTKLKCNVTEYTQELREAAYACGLTHVVESTVYLTYHSFKSFEEVQAYIDKLTYQDILTIKLSGVLDDSEYEPKEIIEDPALDKQESAETQTAEPTEQLPDNERVVRMLRWIVQALKHTNFSPETVELRQLNGGKLAQLVNGLHTVDPAVGYAFYGIGRVDELTRVLQSLETIGGVGTFFVNAEEIETYPEQVSQLIQKGHSVGIIYYPKANADYYGVCHDLLRAKTLLEEQLGHLGVRLVMQAWGEPTEALAEATSALHCTLVSYDQSFAREETRAAQYATEVIEGIYRQNTYGFQRGKIIGFRMNFYERSGLLSELLTELDGTRNIYEVKDIYLLCNNTEQLYTYPLPEENILPEVKDKVYRGQLTDRSIEYMQAHYIGNIDVNTTYQFPGFTTQEIAKLDKVGRIKNEDNAVFLTFDDWGTDVNVTHLLEVLRKHNVKATFCVRTQYVPDNPNLLRAIAMDGHEIISHTHRHVALAHDPDSNWRFVSLTEEEAAVLQDDLEESYHTLQSIVGDIRLENGKPALTRMFRPPTLAISKIGMEAVLDCGYTYIVSGDYTSRDYMATSADELFRKLRSNVRSGSVVIMHFSDNSIYTADAVDLFLTYNEQKTNSEPFTFARLSDYLGVEATPDTEGDLLDALEDISEPANDPPKDPDDSAATSQEEGLELITLKP